MQHVIGIGTLWDNAGVVIEDPVGTFTYTGARAIDVWQNDWGCTTARPPIEADGGPGTAGGHWDEDCMADEVQCTHETPVFFPLNNHHLTLLPTHLNTAHDRFHRYQ